MSPIEPTPRSKHYLMAPFFHYADPEDIFHLSDAFLILHRLLRFNIPENIIQHHRNLVQHSLQLFGWNDLPLVRALQNPEVTQEELFEARKTLSDGSQPMPLSQYWKTRDGLMALPLSWDRPGLIEGDPILPKFIRRKYIESAPLLADESYYPLHRELHKITMKHYDICHKIDQRIVQFYGPISIPHTTVQDLLDRCPTLQQEFFMDWDSF